jgi:hypothetical protein
MELRSVDQHPYRQADEDRSHLTYTAITGAEGPPHPESKCAYNTARAAGINLAEHVAYSMQGDNDAWQGRSL